MGRNKSYELIVVGMLLGIIPMGLALLLLPLVGLIARLFAQ